MKLNWDCVREKESRANESCSRMDLEEHFVVGTKKDGNDECVYLLPVSAGVLYVGRLLYRLVFPGGGDESMMENNLRNFPLSPIDYYNTK
jgi:hypothetical protein